MSSLHPSLRSPAGNLIDGNWVRGDSGVVFESRSPACPDRVIWRGTASPASVDTAVEAARRAQPAWEAVGFDARAKVLRRFAAIASSRLDDIAALIRDEVGKPLWDARAEAQLLANKVEITLDASASGPLSRVNSFEFTISGTRRATCEFRPHGVMAVVGPFNFPAHLPNGHIVPALAMGNTVVFKPSDKAPGVGQLLIELLEEARVAEAAPPGIVNLVQGAADVASRLVSQGDIDGVLFTGSWAAGRRIIEANLDHPGRMLALEMGGNNASVILPDADLAQAVIECVRSAFITSGQRCTCTRRLIVHDAVAPKVIAAICAAARALKIGDPELENGVFMGPLVSRDARDAVVRAQEQMQAVGGTPLLPCRAIEGPRGGWFLTPGVVQVERFVRGVGGSADYQRDGAGLDAEVFGPLLRVAIVGSLEQAIEQANATEFGLAASVFTRSAHAAAAFKRSVKCGCINWNTGTAGASSKLPFGGLGYSGNHRPAGAFSLDYCAYPVAGMTESSDAAPLPTGMSFDPAWIR